MVKGWFGGIVVGNTKPNNGGPRIRVPINGFFPVSTILTISTHMQT